jgi:hypothetical protein
MRQTPALLYIIDKINMLNEELDDCDERSYQFEYKMEELERLEELKDIVIDEIYRRDNPDFNPHLFGKEV